MQTQAELDRKNAKCIKMVLNQYWVASYPSDYRSAKNLLLEGFKGRLPILRHRAKSRSLGFPCHPKLRHDGLLALLWKLLAQRRDLDRQPAEMGAIPGALDFGDILKMPKNLLETVSVKTLCDSKSTYTAVCNSE